MTGLMGPFTSITITFWADEASALIMMNNIEMIPPRICNKTRLSICKNEEEFGSLPIEIYEKFRYQPFLIQGTGLKSLPVTILHYHLQKN
jgi:hypothetical protein